MGDSITSTRSQTRIIGTCAHFGSGQDAFAAAAGNAFGVPVLSMGDAVREIAFNRGIHPSRDNLQAIRRDIDRVHPRDYLVEIISRMAERHSICFVTGFRLITEMQKMRERFPFHLVFVRASERTRLTRVLARANAKDPLDEAGFWAQCLSESELFEVDELERLSDDVMDCEMTLAELQDEIHNIVARLGCANWLLDRQMSLG